MGDDSFATFGTSMGAAPIGNGYAPVIPYGTNDSADEIESVITRTLR